MPRSQKKRMLSSLLQLFQPLDQHPMRTRTVGPEGKSQRERKTARTGESLRPWPPPAAHRGGPRTGPAREGSHTRDSGEADAWARGNAGVVQGGAREERGRPGAPAPPGGLGDPHPHRTEPPHPPGHRREHRHRPGPGGGGRQTRPGRERETKTRSARQPATPGGSGANPRGILRTSPPGSHRGHPSGPGTGQIRTMRNPDPGTSLRPGSLRCGGATPVPRKTPAPRAGLLSAGAPGPRSAPSSPAVRPTAGQPPGSGLGSGSGSRCGSLRSATSTATAGPASGKFPA